MLGKQCRDENCYIRAMAQKMNLKFEKYWEECNLLMVVGAILDSRFKMKLVRFGFLEIYQEPETTNNIELVLKVLNELCGEYIEDHNLAVVPQSGQENVCESSSTLGTSSSVVVRRSTMSGMTMFQSFERSVDTF